MKKIFFIVFCCLGFNAVSQVMTPNVDKVAEGTWWIFRKDIDINETIDSSRMQIAADSKYWLWINDKMVVFEGGLKRGPDPKNTYADVFNNVDGLKTGKNSIVVLVWYFGKQGFSHRNSGNAGLYVDLKVNKTEYNGDETWKVAQHPAYYIPLGEKPNYRLPESNIGFDAQKDINFSGTGFNYSNWANCKLLSLEKADWNKLVKRPIPQWKNYGLKSYQKTEKKGNQIIAYLPYNAHITPYLKVKAKGGEKIDVRTDDYMGGSAPNVHAEYVCKEGLQEYESLGWMNGHYVIYTIPDSVEVIDIKYRETGYDTEFAGSFICNDEFYNTLWKKAQRTLYVTMRDTYMDCPDRERAQWWGDVVNELGETFYSLDPKSHMLTSKAILELMNWQRADGTIYSPVPAGNWENELPMQMLASVSYYGFYTYYMGSGDKQTINDVFYKVKKYLEVWEINNEGLVVPREGGWSWGDWGENIDMEPMYSLWYSIALDGYEKMAYIFGRNAEALWAINKNKRIKAAFHKKYWKGNYYMSEDYKGLPDDRVQALAVLGGFLPKEEYPTIRKFFGEQYHASPYMEKHVLESLCVMGYHEDALVRMKKRFAKMTESELSTLWEGWGIGNEGYGGGSYNHAWSGGGLTILSQYIAGIAPIDPAFKRFSVVPVLAGLKEIKSVTPTKFGDIKLTVKDDGTACTLELTVPKDTKAELKLPPTYAKYEHNGKTINSSSKQYLREGIWTYISKQ